jgi:hypothetical protein
MAWRAKTMTLAEWVPFQAAFEDVFLAMKGDPEMALLVQSPPGEDLSRLFVTDRHADIVERLSPGGWEDSDQPNGGHVALLVGSGDFPARFGIQLGDH